MLNQLLTSNLLLEVAQTTYVWQDHLGKVITTLLLSMVPTFEGRFALITGVGLGMPPVFAYVLTLIFSSVPIPFIFLLLRPVLDWFYTLPIKPVQKFAGWLEHRSASKREEMLKDNKKGIMGKLSKHVSSETLELIALYIFVAVPLPMTGIWTGTAIATLFNMPKGKSTIAILLGNASAIGIMLALLLAGIELLF